MFDAIQLKRAAAQLKRAVEILAVDPKDDRALSYVAARAMMDGKDEQKWGANHTRRASRSAKPTLDPGAVSRSAGPCSYFETNRDGFTYQLTAVLHDVAEQPTRPNDPKYGN